MWLMIGHLAMGLSFWRHVHLLLATRSKSCLPMTVRFILFNHSLREACTNSNLRILSWSWVLFFRACFLLPYFVSWRALGAAPTHQTRLTAGANGFTQTGTWWVLGQHKGCSASRMMSLAAPLQAAIRIEEILLVVENNDHRVYISLNDDDLAWHLRLIDKASYPIDAGQLRTLRIMAVQHYRLLWLIKAYSSHHEWEHF